MRSVFGFRLQRLTNELRHPVVADRPGAARSQLVVESAHAVREESPGAKFVEPSSSANAVDNAAISTMGAASRSLIARPKD